MKLPRCEGYLPRACFYKSLCNCFRGPSGSKLLRETEEGSFREGISAHGLLGNALGKHHPDEIKPRCAASTSFASTETRGLQGERYGREDEDEDDELLLEDEVIFHGLAGASFALLAAFKDIRSSELLTGCKSVSTWYVLSEHKTFAQSVVFGHFEASPTQILFGLSVHVRVAGLCGPPSQRGGMVKCESTCQRAKVVKQSCARAQM